MNKLFTKIATAFVGMAMAVGVGVAVGVNNAKAVKAADTVTFTVGEDSGSTTLSKDGINVSTTNGTFSRTDNYRVYANNSMTISSSSGNITAMSFTISQNTFTADVGTWNDSGKSWSGSAASVTLSASGGQVRFTTFSVTVGGAVVTYTITYDANGGSGEMSDSTNNVAACTFTAPEGKKFSEWNTAADGSGDSYAAGDPVSSDVDLFAIWVDKPLCVTLDNIGENLGSAYSSELQTVDIVDGDDTYTLNYVNGKKQGNAMILQKSSGAFISNHTVIPGSITSVEVFINSGASGSATYDVAFGTSEFTTATAGIGAVNITGGNSHEFENSSVADAAYFCVTLGAAYNGQVLKIVVNYEESGLQNLYIGRIQDGQDPEYASSYSLPYSTTEDMYSFAAFAGEEIESRSAISAINWTVSDSSIMSIYQSDGRVRVTTAAKSGTVTLTAKHSASTKLYKDTSVTLSVYKGWVESITVTGSMSKTSYYVGESWDPTGLLVTATYHYTGDEIVTSGIAWSYNPAAPATSVNSVVATATFEGESASSTAQAVTVTRTNPIQVLYTKASGASVDVYGYYVGFLDGTGPVIMDGEYGIVIYNSSADVSGYTEKETILHVTGSISIYRGLYEIGSSTISVASGTFDAPDTPVVYATAGGETADKASRLTTVTGTPTLTSGSFDDAAGTSDIKMNFAVGSNTIQVFYKKAAQTADADAFAAIKAAVADSAEITIKGFTGWYNGFQVQMNGYVPPAEGYTAEVFAQDLLDQTDAVCKDYDDVTNNHDAIEAIWSNLASNDKYPSLPSAEKTILAEAARDESGTVVEQAMARYDYLTGKYNLSNFINGRTPVSFEAHITTISSEANTTNAMIIVTVIALTSVSAIAVLLVIKRRKTY